MSADAVLTVNATVDGASESRASDNERLGFLLTDVANALIGTESLSQMLQRSAEALQEHMHAAFARIWVFNASRNLLELKASAGLYRHLDGAHREMAVGEAKSDALPKSASLI